MIQRRHAWRTAAVLFLALWLPQQVQAGLLDDDEARKAILALTAKFDTRMRAMEARLDEMSGRIDAKADKRIAVDMLNQREQMMQEMASLRGEVEILSHALSASRKDQKDLFVDLDSRIEALGPQQEALPTAEKQSYDAAVDLFDAGNHKRATAAFRDFLRGFPHSTHASNARYRIGASSFALGRYTDAIREQDAVLAQYGNSPDAPEAMLGIASSHVQLNDKKNARKTLQQLIARFPESAAARIAKQRLTALK